MKKQFENKKTWKETPFGSVAKRGGDGVTPYPPYFHDFLLPATGSDASEPQKGQELLNVEGRNQLPGA